MSVDFSHMFRALPSVDALLAQEAVQSLVDLHGRAVVVQGCRTVLEEGRRQIRQSGTMPERLTEQVIAYVLHRTQPSLQPVINATGVIIHTNLGRAPLSDAALHAMVEVGCGYSNLEFDLEAGARGSRYDHVAGVLAELSGAEAGLVVNNNAAALVLVLSALAAEREVVLSRAHLIEIGGGFRIPDIMRESGALLKEVGTTNRTYLSDYSDALSEATAMFLRLHTSNFRIEGFVHQPSLAELVDTAHQRGVVVVDDLGSGAFLDTASFGMAREPMVQESIATGADLVLFSGDKLLGGPQAGCIVGKSEFITRLRRYPLARALRVDKTTLAALDATLRAYQRGRATEEIPIWQMISKSGSQLQATAAEWVETLRTVNIAAEVIPGHSTVGGGSLPTETLPTWLVALPDPHPGRWATALRASRPAVVARIENDRLLFDPRTVLPGQESTLLSAIVDSYHSGGEDGTRG